MADRWRCRYRPGPARPSHRAPTDEFAPRRPVLTCDGPRRRRRHGDDRPASRRGLPRGHRPLPARAARALLPDARLRARRRGPRAGDLPARLALVPRLRGPVLAAHLALPDRHQRLPHRAGQPQPAAAARPGSGAPSSDPQDKLVARRRGALAGAGARRDGRRRQRPGDGRHRPGQRPAGPDRRPAAPAAAAARRAGAARRAAAARRRGRRDARHHGRRGQQQPAAGPRPARRRPA